MKSAVCTLFEGSYHYGTATLINSLYINGFRGTFYAGDRGVLPEWLSKATASEKKSIQDPATKILQIAEGMLIYLLPLGTDYHLTNYKPDFMLDLLKGQAADVDAIFYFDPDIVVTGPWKYFEQWLTCGVALCEDINSPKTENHPRRIAWRRYFSTYGLSLKFKNQIYVNGGFVGVNVENFNFLSVWREIQEGMAPAIGGLHRSSLSGSSLPEHASGEFDPFPKGDQDALNCSVEAWDGKVSFLGKDCMAFQPGISLMSHAVGPKKPWLSNPLVQFFHGYPLRNVDKDYWRTSRYPLMIHSRFLIFYRNKSLKVISFLERFYKRK